MPVERTDTRRSGTAGSWALLGLVVLIGLLLRGYQLGSESLWVDEGYTVKAALRTPGETLRTIGESINAPVYPLLMHEWIRWFGASETALRFPSVIFSVLTILLVHRLARLLFDEATSALDYESERAVMTNMRAICKGRTVLIIAHRLSTVRHANRIVVVEKGRIVETGSHAELIDRPDGHYAHLYRLQSGEA